MKYVSIMSGLFLVALSCFWWGFSASEYKSYPYSIIKPYIIEIEEFAGGHPLEKQTTLAEKIQNDIIGIPQRDLKQDKFPKGYDFVEVKDLTSKVDHEFSKQYIYINRDKLRESDIAGLVMITKLRLKEKSEAEDYFVFLDIDGNIVKIFDLYGDEGCKCGSSYDFKLHSRKVTEKPIKQSEFIQLNSCGGRDFAVKSKYFHHHYRQDSQSKLSVWALDGAHMVEYSKLDGSEIQRITFSEVINANPLVHIFESRLNMAVKDKWVYGETDFNIMDGKRSYYQINNADNDPFHPNDIDPLSKELADKYDMFEEGDIMISFRSINLIFVVRPATKKIIWYDIGQTSRQHDTDWSKQGTITVFDNKFHNNRSVISEITPNSKELSYLVGADDSFRFYKPTGGSHEVSDDGKLVFFGSDTFIYGKGVNDPDLSFIFANQFKDGKFLHPSIEVLLDSISLNNLKASNCR